MDWSHRGGIMTDPARQFTVAVVVGSVSQPSLNRTFADALARLAPAAGLRFADVPIDQLPFFGAHLQTEEHYPEVGRAFKRAIDEADGILFVTPEYNRSIPGGLKNAIDWASRPWGQNSFDHIPAAVIGASIGQIGTAVAQQSLRGVLSFCNARQMTAPEAYIHFSPDVFAEDGTVSNPDTEEFLRSYMADFREHVQRVLTVLPRQASDSS
jgi:chromate reductase